MRIRCLFGMHDFSMNCEKCQKCGQERENAHVWRDFSPEFEICDRCSRKRSHQWKVETLPSSHPLEHWCPVCHRSGPIFELWRTCACPKCKEVRAQSVATLVDTISRKNGRSHWKSRDGGAYRFHEDPTEVPLGLAVLTDRLKREARNIDRDELKRVTTLSSVIIHIQRACDEGCKQENIDCSVAVQLARQELERRNLWLRGSS
jgi:hypothetical protein